jgi:plastocyanin
MRKERIVYSKLLIIGLFLVLYSILTTITYSSKQESTEHVVEMHKMKFVPDSITVKLGDTIKFVNKDSSLHNVVVKSLKINSKYIRKNEHLDIKPSKTGKHEYYCQPHKTMGMKGTITVKD